MTAIFDAIEFAAGAHRGHFRKGTRVPCIVHPLNVEKILIDGRCPEEVIVAGILHDTVEDTSVSREDIRLKFGEAVDCIVEGATEPDKTRPWEDRKTHTIESLKSATEGVLLVACTDKIENLETIRGTGDGSGRRSGTGSSGGVTSRHCAIARCLPCWKCASGPGRGSLFG